MLFGRNFYMNWYTTNLRFIQELVKYCSTNIIHLLSLSYGHWAEIAKVIDDKLSLFLWYAINWSSWQHRHMWLEIGTSFRNAIDIIWSSGTQSFPPVFIELKSSFYFLTRRVCMSSAYSNDLRRSNRRAAIANFVISAQSVLVSGDLLIQTHETFLKGETHDITCLSRACIEWSLCLVSEAKEKFCIDTRGEREKSTHFYCSGIGTHKNGKQLLNMVGQFEITLGQRWIIGIEPHGPLVISWTATFHKCVWIKDRLAKNAVQREDEQ